MQYLQFDYNDDDGNEDGGHHATVMIVCCNVINDHDGMVHTIL